MSTTPRDPLRRKGRPCNSLTRRKLLGGFAAVSGRISLDSVAAGIRGTFSGKLADRNVAAATEAFGLARKAQETADAEAD